MNTANGDCKDWKAWHDRQPIGPATLHVTGKCTFPTSGYSVELKPAKPQGINPKIYLLQKIVHAPTGPTNDVKTPVSVDYKEKTEAHYDEVSILPDGVKVPVKEVS
jgi:hypothetical protein